MNAKEELTKLLMESYDRGVKDAMQAGLAALEKAVLAEREACAKVAELVGQDKNHHGIAAAIRARSKNE